MSFLMAVTVRVIVKRILKNWVNPHKVKLQSTPIPALWFQILKLLLLICQVHECDANVSGVNLSRP